MKSEIELQERMSAADEHNNKTAIEISELVLGARLDLKKRREPYRTVHGTDYKGGL